MTIVITIILQITEIYEVVGKILYLFYLYLTIDDPLGQNWIITCRPHRSEPRWADLIFQLIHSKEFRKPRISLIFLPEIKPRPRVSSFQWSLSQDSSIATMTVKYTAGYTKNLHEEKNSWMKKSSIHYRLMHEHLSFFSAT